MPIEFSPAPSRRALLETSALGVLGSMVPGPLRAAPPTTRYDIGTTNGAAMATLYAKAVTAMQDPAINYPPQPQSWIFQSFIHGVPENPFDPANSNGLRHGTPSMTTRIDELYGKTPPGSLQDAWKQAATQCWGTCTHGSPYFTVWHRWYMYYFERVCRVMCKDSAFTLPYWNYASNIGSSLQLPPPFLQIGSLMIDDRGLGFGNPQGAGPQNVAMNNGGYMPYPSIDYQPALAAKVMWPSDTKFFAPPSPGYSAMGFSGRLECVPHDMVHDSVGGWMGNVPSAAGDPVFYVHHCQVDRLYAAWEAEAGVSYNWGTSATQPAEASWKAHVAAFVDETGKVVNVKMDDALSTKALGYGYDVLPKAKASQVVIAATVAREATPMIKLAAMKGGALIVGGAGAATTLQPAPTERSQVQETLTPSARPFAAQNLVLENLKLFRRPPAPLSVFLNLPGDTKPDIAGPFYVGTINLFRVPVGEGASMSHDDRAEPMDHMPETGAADVTFDVGAVLANQKAKGLWDGGSITVTVTTVGADRPSSVVYVTFSGVSLMP